MTRFQRFLVFVQCLVFFFLSPRSLSLFSQSGAIVKGIVVEQGAGPIAGATVRIQAASNAATSGSDGTFTLSGLKEGVPITVSAWKHKYYCAKVEKVIPPASGVTLTLRLYQTDDNPKYQWILPASNDSSVVTCATCKSGVTKIWLDNDAHARSGNNARFLSMYNGTDISGKPGVPPGFIQDFPGTAGSCANCHAPGQALDAPFTTSMNALTGVNQTFGVHCDFCHKVAGVYLNPATGLPYDNVPGVLSMDVRRPFPETARYQLFFGTFDDDNVPEEDTNLPLIMKSQWCAPCHQFSFWGTPIYQSFKEWLESPYPKMGVECQTCHMPSDGVMTNVAPGMGGVERDPKTIHAHTMPGAASTALLQNTVKMTLTAKFAAGSVVATAAITNDRAGHHVPTDHPARNMILLVQATDEKGKALAFAEGSLVPVWGGDLANRPGKGYAKILRDALSGQSPVASYWKQTFIESDNRIRAFATDTSSYTFKILPETKKAIVTARLIFRRAFKALGDQKAWAVPDITMAEASSELQIPSIPGKATLISPSGSVALSKPTYTWNAVPAATWYYLWVNYEGTPTIQTWYTAEQAGCVSGAGTCSVTPTTALPQGAAQWWIQTWNDAGYGPWSDAMMFMVTNGAPGKAGLISPSGTVNTATPAYVWNAVASATWYQLWVNDSMNSGKIITWYTAAQAGCSVGTGTCSISPVTALASGTAQWWIQTWNEGGYGPWSNGMVFNVAIAGSSGKGMQMSPKGN
jgi:hypothetical protein